MGVWKKSIFRGKIAHPSCLTGLGFCLMTENIQVTKNANIALERVALNRTVYVNSFVRV